MSVIHNALSGLALGAPQHHGLMTLFPLLSEVDIEPHYLMLDEALAAGACEVSEVSESGEVSELMFENLGDQPVLLLDGEELVGAKQNRILNLTLLCAAGIKTRVPVSCVEQGRWSYRSRRFASGERALFSRARAAKMRSVNRSMQYENSRRSDQGEVWREVDDRLQSSCAESTTSASEAAYAAASMTTEKYLDALPATAAQLGSVFAVNGKVLALEVLECPQAYHQVHRKLVESFVVDLDGAGAIEEAGTTASKEDAAAFIADIVRQKPGCYEAIGLGHDLRIETPDLIGAALEMDEKLLHLSAFRHRAVPA